MKKNVSWLLLGNVFFAFSQFIIFTIIVKSLSVHDVGVYSLGLAITAPISLLLSFQLKVLISTEKEIGVEMVQSYFLTRWISFAIGILIIVITSFILGYRDYIFIIIALFVIKGIESLNDVYYGYYYKYNKENNVGKSLIYKSLINVISFGIGAIILKSLFLSLVITIALMTFRLMLIERTLFLNTFKFAVTKGQIKDVIGIVKYGLPLGISSFLISINTNIPRIIIEKFSSAYILGVFTSLIYFITIINIFISAVMQYLLPRISKAWREDKKLYRRIVKLITMSILAFGCVLYIFFSIFGELVLNLVYNEEIAQYDYLFPMITLYGTLNFLVFLVNTIMNAKRNFKVQPIILSITTIVTLSVSIILINEIGIVGAILSLIVSSLFNLLITLAFLRKQRVAKEE